jgi:hypothetical protein
MKLLKGIGMAFCLVVLCLIVAPKTKADEQVTKTAVTFAVPVEVPGVSAQILPAGTYRFMTLESTADRDIIQISSPDGSQVFTTMIGIPNSRLKAPDLITVVFTNRPAADPVALKVFYCPGRAWGDQLVYEKPRAAQLAKESNEPVLSTSVVQAMASEAVLKSAPVEAVGPGGETVALGQAVDAPAAGAPVVAAVATTPGAATVSTTEGATVAVASAPAPEITAAVAPPPVVEPASATEPAVSATPTVAEVSQSPAIEPTVAVAAPPPPAPEVTVEPVATPAPEAAPEPVAAAMPPPPAPTVIQEPAVAAAPEVATATLPKTASLLPLVGLAGLLLLGSGFLLTGLVKQRA